jgi:hypothetical protein
MSFELTSYTTGVLTGALAAIYPWVKLLLERRDKNAEREAKEKAEAKVAAAEAKLAAMKRRAPALNPVIGISPRKFNGVQIEMNEPGKFARFPAGQAQLLCFTREEVERNVEAGKPVFLLVENFGAETFEITIKKNHETLVIQELQDEADGLLAVCYPYMPDKHGAVEMLEVGFLRADGSRDVHHYETRHGVRRIRRLDPK